MWLYLLKSSACLAILILFYKVFLEKENMHFHKRYYLLFTLIASFGIPLITYTTFVQSANSSKVMMTSEISNQVLTSNLFLDNIEIIIGAIYVIGVLVFASRFMFHLLQIHNRIRSNEKEKDASFINVLISDLRIPHSFFNYIFFNKNLYKTSQIPLEVYWHEQTHARQKHSIDILIIEFIQIVFWFNPLIYLLKKEVKLNHEFLADQAVLKKGVNTSEYQKTLLAFSSNNAQPLPINIGMASAINYSLIKKRFTVMKAKSSQNRIGLRYLLLLPVLTLLLFSFTTESIVELDSDLVNETEFVQLEQQEGATKAQIEEYNALAKKLDFKEEDKNIIRKKDVTRIKYLYDLMTPAQRESAAVFPNIAPPPPPAPAPAPTIEGKPDLPPPPPPIPDNATDAQKKKYKEAAKIYKLKAEKVKLQKLKKTEEIKLRKLKSKENKVKKEYIKQQKAQAVKLNKMGEAKVAARVKRLEDREGAMVNRNKAMIAERLVRSEERQAAMADRKKAMVAERVSRHEERTAVLADRKKYLEQEKKERVEVLKTVAEERKLELQETKLRRVEEREKYREERAVLAELKESPRRISPSTHIKEMVEKGAVFYFNGKEIPAKKALQLSNSKRKINISTTGSDSNRPTVHLTTGKSKDKN